MTFSSEKGNVTAALGKLRQTIDDEKERLNEEVAQAMKDGEYDTASAMIQFAQRLQGFQGEVESLAGKWEELEDVRRSSSPKTGQIVNTLGLPHGRRQVTSEIQPRNQEGDDNSTADCVHILEALVKLGGRAENQEVQRTINKKVKLRYERYRAAKSLLAQNGWTTSASTNRNLAISDKGREWLSRRIAQPLPPASNRVEAHPEVPPSSTSNPISPHYESPKQLSPPQRFTSSGPDDFLQI